MINSPILSRVPPVLYLDEYINHTFSEHKLNDLYDFQKKSATNPRLIQKEIFSNEIRIIAMMDRYKKELYDKYKNKSQNNKISIIMPTKNRANKIGYAISSVLMQSHENWELIIVDDGGGDNTEFVVNEFNDTRIKYYRK